jgi:hypothetical protein
MRHEIKDLVQRVYLPFKNPLSIFLKERNVFLQTYLCFFANMPLFLSFHSCGKAFLQLWKTFTTTVERIKRKGVYGKCLRCLQKNIAEITEQFPRNIQFRKNALFYPILSTKNFSSLSLANYRLHPTNYCKNMLNHRAEHEKKKLFFVVESFLKFVCCFDFQYKSGKKPVFDVFKENTLLRKHCFIGY